MSVLPLGAQFGYFHTPCVCVECGAARGLMLIIVHLACSVKCSTAGGLSVSILHQLIALSVEPPRAYWSVFTHGVQR